MELSHREIEVLLLIKEGLRNREIGEKLGITTKTIENHVRTMLHKTQTASRTALVVSTLKAGIIPLN